MNDFERRLSESLKSVGNDYVPENEPAAAQHFIKAARRNRILYPIAAFAAIGVLVGGVVMAQRVLSDRSTIREPAPKPPAGEENVKPGSLIFVYSADGAIWGQTEEDVVLLTDSPERDARPALSPDGRTLVFERGEERGDTELVQHDLRSGDEIVATPGEWPSYGPNGDLVWLEHAFTDPKLVIGPLFSEPVDHYDLRDFDIQAAQAPTWSDDGRTIYFDGLAAEGWGVYQLTLGPQAQPYRLEAEISGRRGASFFTATGATQGGVDVIRVCCGQNPEFRDQIEIGHIAFTEGGPEYSTIVVLDLELVDAGAQEYSFAAAGTLIADPGAQPPSWGGQVGRSWLIGDNDALQLVHVDTRGRDSEVAITDFEAHAGETDYEGLAVPDAVRGSEEGQSDSEDREGFALWPETSRSEVQPRQGIGWRDDPSATARHFVRQVIGWRHFTMSELTAYGNQDHVQIRVDSTRSPSNGLMDIYLDKRIGDGRWSVIGVGDPRMKITGVSAQIDGRKVTLGFADRGAASALVRIEFGGQPVFEEEVLSPESVVETTLAEKPSEPGSYLILRMNEKGLVYSVSGGTLPAHDFVAG